MAAYDVIVAGLGEMGSAAAPPPNGFKFVPVVGEIVADLATTGATAHPIGLFDPRRFPEVTP